MQKLIDLADEVAATLENLQCDLDCVTPTEKLNVLMKFVDAELPGLVKTATKLTEELRDEEQRREELESFEDDFEEDFENEY